MRGFYRRNLRHCDLRIRERIHKLRVSLYGFRIIWESLHTRILGMPNGGPVPIQELLGVDVQRCGRFPRSESGLDLLNTKLAESRTLDVSSGSGLPRHSYHCELFHPRTSIIHSNGVDGGVERRRPRGMSIKNVASGYKLYLHLWCMNSYSVNQLH